MKIAPLIHAIKKASQGGVDIAYRLVHTGQHYDKQMSYTFFEELNIPASDANLGCGGGSQAQQTAPIMVAFEKELLEHPTDLVLVVGDVTSTMASSNLAKAGIEDSRIYLMGNVMIDTLLANIDRFVKPAIYDELGLQEKGYMMLTLHRPANVEETNHLKALMTEIVQNAKGLPIIFPIHPPPPYGQFVCRFGHRSSQFAHC